VSGPLNQGTRMQAITRDRYGPPSVLRVQEIDQPSPKRGQVRVRIHAVSLNAADHYLVSGRPWPLRLAFGLRRPRHRVPGIDAAGVVEAIGEDTAGVALGTRVVGDLSPHGFGAFAEFAVAPASAWAVVPGGVTMEQAASLPTAGATALQALRDAGRLIAGQRVLVNGASGGVGTFAVQIGKAMGAHVTAVCSAAKANAVRALGADVVHAYESHDFTQPDVRFDVILDAAARHPLRRVKRVLHGQGRYIIVGGQFRRLLMAMTLGRSRRVRALLVKPNADDLTTLMQMIAAGTLRPVLQPFDGLVSFPAALEALEQRQITGKAVVCLAA
jgi:NADPH:quinone reductase-like Zn-dependent oxidoreductase